MLEPHIYKLEFHPDYVVLVSDNTYRVAYAKAELARRVFERLRGEETAVALDSKAEALAVGH